MQNQKTESYQIPDNLPILTPEEETYRDELYLGTNQVEAYRKAYGAEGYSLPALQVRACRKAADPKIQAHLRAMQSVAVAKSALSSLECVADEMAFAQRAENAGNYGAAGAARDRRNKLLGHYTEKLDVTVTDIADELKELAKISPELAKAYADKEGITWH